MHIDELSGALTTEYYTQTLRRLLLLLAAAAAAAALRGSTTHTHTTRDLADTLADTQSRDQ